MSTTEIILNKIDYSRILHCIKVQKELKSISGTEMEKLMEEFKRARIVEPYEVPGNVVTMNSVVKITFPKLKKEVQLKIVYPHEARIKEWKISILSPIAIALLGYKTGDEIDWLVPGGVTKIRIDDIIYQPEAAGHYDL